MKCKALLTGKNNLIIDEFFGQLSDTFEVMTTSGRYDDIARHVKYFQPDIFVYCLNNESKDDINIMVNTKYLLSSEKVSIILIGAEEECREFERKGIYFADLVLTKPLTAASIQKRILDFLDKGSDEPVSMDNNISLPKENPQMSTEPLQKPQKSPKKDAASAPDPSQKKHILVIDDNSMMLRVIKENLHDKYNVATAVNGKIAEKFLDHKKTDLIILDYAMPDESGPELLKRLRTMDKVKDVPVIFLTGVTERKKIQKALDLKPQGYLLKPIDRDKLLKAVEKIIG